MASSLEDLIKVIFVRGCVFVEEGGVAYSEEFDGGEQSAIHFLGLAGGDPFGAARVRQVDGASRIDRICVRQAYRGKGLGDRLLTYVLASLDDMGFSQVSFLAEGMLVQWLRNHDFTIARKIKRVDDSEYFEMFRAVSSKPIQTQVQENTALFSEPQHLAEAPLAVSAQPGSERTCVLSHTPFEVTEDDLVYYRKLGVPSPTLCPEERARRRMAFANQRNLFVRKCAATGKRIITNYPPEAHAPVYEIMYWLSDAWDKFASGRKYDFNRPFFEQFGDLMRVAPRPNLQKAAALDENSDYTNYAGENKNCYLIFDSDKSRDCCHSYSINSCVDVIDCFRVEKSELCYECIDSTNCYNSVYLQNCDTCSDSVLLKNCI
ncbi:MAG TPA: GNAT family N-acetyltransferase, partial [Oligoflexia bacterium]|nr:GNAT family N-acetyltransferase [Oligoflexia bacterium]